MANRDFGEPLSVPAPFVEMGIPAEDLGLPVFEFVNQGDVFRMFVLPKETEVPESVARELRRRTYIDRAMQADSYRFGNADRIRERFLFDRNGRRLHILGRLSTTDLLQEGYELAGVAWEHPLVGDDWDRDMVRACDRYSEKSEITVVKGEAELCLLPRRHLASEHIATLATRIYDPFRGRRLSAPLNEHTLIDYYDENENCHGVVIRVNDNDSNAVAAFSRDMGDIGSFVHIEQQQGVSTMIHERPSLRVDPEATLPKGPLIKL